MENENVIEVKPEGKFKRFWRKHKTAIIAGGIVGGVIAVTAILTGKKQDNVPLLEATNEPSGDDEKTIDMRFVDPENENVLGSIPCTESYAKEMLEE